MIDATDTIETSRMLALPDELMLEVVKHVGSFVAVSRAKLTRFTAGPTSRSSEPLLNMPRARRSCYVEALYQCADPPSPEQEHELEYAQWSTYISTMRGQVHADFSRAQWVRRPQGSCI